ncbi:MAG: ExbD/TolR family protein, partial [Alphaproteobacteria bacterium]
VFIMLIFFIVTATFVREQGIDVTSPDKDQPPDQPDIVAIVVAVDPNNNIFVEEGGQLRQVDVRSVRANVARKLAENRESPVVVQAAETSDMGVVVRVMDQAKLARDNPPVPVSIATTEG